MWSFLNIADRLIELSADISFSHCHKIADRLIEQTAVICLFLYKIALWLVFVCLKLHSCDLIDSGQDHRHCPCLPSLPCKCIYLNHLCSQLTTPSPLTPCTCQSIGNLLLSFVVHDENIYEIRFVFHHQITPPNLTTNSVFNLRGCHLTLA